MSKYGTVGGGVSLRRCRWQCVRDVAQNAKDGVGFLGVRSLRQRRAARCNAKMKPANLWEGT